MNETAVAGRPVGRVPNQRRMNLGKALEIPKPGMPHPRISKTLASLSSTLVGKTRPFAAFPHMHQHWLPPKTLAKSDLKTLFRPNKVKVLCLRAAPLPGVRSPGHESAASLIPGGHFTIPIEVR